MTDKLKHLYSAYREQINYLIFGVLTTAVNWITYYLLMLVPFFASGDTSVAILNKQYRVGYLLANAVAFAVAVVFSYWANRRFVFEEKARTTAAVLRQFFLFAGTRLFSFAVEEALMFVFVELVGLGEIVPKIPVAVIVVVLNYIFGKFLVFRKRSRPAGSHAGEKADAPEDKLK